MSILTASELSQLTIDRLIFHLVGPDRSKNFQLLDEAPVTPHVDFILERIRANAAGNLYEFDGASATLASLRAIGRNKFVTQSRELADRFQEKHVGNALAGVFFVVLMSLKNNQKVVALMKMDHKDVLSYTVKSSNGRNKPDFSRIVNALTDEKNAVQKFALARLNDKHDRLVVRDRSQNGIVPRYFEEFLDAKRVHTDEELSAIVLDAVMNAIQKHRDEVDPTKRKNAYQNVREAIQQGGNFDAEQPELFLALCLGVNDPDSPLIVEVKDRLRAQHLEGATFAFKLADLAASSRQEILTNEGVEIRCSKEDISAGIVKTSTSKGRTIITITTSEILVDDELPLKRTRK